MDITNTQFYLGTARGVLLCTTDKANDVKVFKNGEKTEVTALANGRHENEIALGYGNGNVDIFDTKRRCFTKKIDNLEGSESITGICHINQSLVVAKHDGVINIWRDKLRDFFSINLNENSTLDAIEHNQNNKIVGTGGEANDFKTWNIETKQCVFKAKSLGHDHLQLPIPTSITGICFFNGAENLGACCTAQGRVLLYDDRTQRKPVVNYFHEKASYSTISSSFNDLQLFVGNTKGYMQWLDLRCTTKSLRTYTNFRGAVTDIACDSVKSSVASVSLDRHLRIHKIESKELIRELYMKQSLSKMLIQPIIKEESSEEDDEFETLFNEMEHV
ncbi:WD repeat-containing protein 74 [Dendroctonus ponderosae]|uniref:Uncharacterized protein n=1 Tax=Dendroctonus ponderosae TaxID=77166 RepID=U4UQE9_DENPD|nr:WD repeat-containing protein 74 [Dendroctonus ponderosae]ERL92341.1 hypothetical protein D910_09658 [Dendroctonus ponderosae]KAH1015422.1 hypothetical protein HUJ05_013147 [Dendroctonus ponderosae]